MPISAYVPIGFVMMIVGLVLYLLTNREKRIWLGLAILGVIIALGTLGMIIFVVGRM
jgi:hypothetical protein